MLKRELPSKMRLHRLIALCSELSRRKAEEAILASRVAVNGEVVSAVGTSVEPLRDRVQLDGKLLKLPRAFVYLVFFKPGDCLVTADDPEGRKTIWAYLPEWKGKLQSAGRLDYDSEGLLILSNDGAFLQALTHPQYELWKIYCVKVKGSPSFAALKKLRDGIRLEDGLTLPARAKQLAQKGEKNSWLEIAIREGRNRQLRRMCEAIGHPPLRLVRVSVGNVSLGKLKRGEWRHLAGRELVQLRKMMHAPGL